MLVKRSSMKSIKEKRILVKWARAMNETIDPALVEEVERYDQLQREISESIKSNTFKDLLGAAQGVKLSAESINIPAPAQVIKIEYPKPPSIYELELLLQEVQDELVQTQATEESPATETVSPTEKNTASEVQTDSIIERTLKHITQEVKNESQSYQQPDPALPGRSIDDLRKKIKYLEAWISKISLTGPGGGVVELRLLDDVSTAPFNLKLPGDRVLAGGKALVYNAANAKFELGVAGTSVNLLSVSSAIIPDTGNVYDLGSASKRWGTLYLANNTIDLGGALISSDGTGQITISSNGAILPVNSKVSVGGDVERAIATVGTTGAVTTIVPFYTQSVGLNTIAVNFTFGANPDDYVFTNFTFNSGTTITQTSRAQFYF